MGLAGQARLKNVRFVDSSIEPVGFGIRKLVLQGTLPESVDSSIMVSSNAVATASPGIIDIEDVLDALGALDGVMSVGRRFLCSKGCLLFGFRRWCLLLVGAGTALAL